TFIWNVNGGEPLAQIDGRVLATPEGKCVIKEMLAPSISVWSTSHLSISNQASGVDIGREEFEESIVEADRGNIIVPATIETHVLLPEVEWAPILSRLVGDLNHSGTLKLAQTSPETQRRLRLPPRGIITS